MDLLLGAQSERYLHSSAYPEGGLQANHGLAWIQTNLPTSRAAKHTFIGPSPHPGAFSHDCLEFQTEPPEKTSQATLSVRL
jgi:hypothetical protein